MNEIELQLSKTIEDMLVAKNPRGMKDVQSALEVGYYYRAAMLLKDLKGTVLIGTGFPVADTFETDGPVGAIALYNALETLGATPVLVCGDPFAHAVENEYRVHKLPIGDLNSARSEAIAALAMLKPVAIISIERPGLSAKGRYFNMRGEDISERCACFDHYLNEASCPTIAIGDGGNEIGMGNIKHAIEKLDIVPAITECDELLISDVSNWAAYGIISFLSLWSQKDLLGDVKPLAVLEYISKKGSVDGVTRENNLTEDSLPATEGQALVLQMRKLLNFI